MPARVGGDDRRRPGELLAIRVEVVDGTDDVIPRVPADLPAQVILLTFDVD